MISDDPQDRRSGSRSAKTGESDALQPMPLQPGWLRQEIDHAQAVMRRWYEESDG